MAGMLTAVEAAVLAAAGAGPSARWVNWEEAWWVVLPALPIGWSFVGVGLFAWLRRPDNRVGVLMIATGFGVFASGLWMVPNSLVSTAGLVVSVWFLAILVHLLLAFPSGRLSGRTDRFLVMASYLAVLPGNATQMLASDASVIGPPGVHNLLFVHASQRVAGTVSTVWNVLFPALLTATAALLVRRWRRGTSAQRRALSPVLIVGAFFGIFTGLRLTFADVVGLPGPLIAIMAIPYAFLAGLMRIRFFQMRALGALMTGLGDGTAHDLPAALASAFGDVPVQVVYWLADHGCYVDGAGRPAEPLTGDGGQTVIPIGRDGHHLGAVVLDAAIVAEHSQLLRGLIAAVQLTMDNQRLQAELRAGVAELKHSRAQVVSVGEEQRQLLERNLHDGAQQMLVAVRLRLGLIRQSLSAHAATRPPGEDSRTLSEAGVQVGTAITDLDTALAELRDLAHGLHPAVLSTRGLAAAVRSLAERATVAVRVNVQVRRLPEAAESAAYFIIAESLTNVAKHAAATHAVVTVAERSGHLLVEIHDDGIGGANLAGSGLQSMAVRVAALDGQLHVSSPAQDGTVIRAEIPLPADGRS
jgi:signal transduction histidine kinase